MEINEASGEKLKPEIICFYNETKGGVDTVDQLASNYSLARKTNRWPLAVFFHLLDIAGINAQVVYFSNNQKKILRRLFLRGLSEDLTTPLIRQRLTISCLPRELVVRIKMYLGQDIAETQTGNLPLVSKQKVPAKQKRCEKCIRKLDRKTTTQCVKCSAFVCMKDHANILCKDCFLI